jgi:hypothetical protein
VTEISKKLWEKGILFVLMGAMLAYFMNRFDGTQARMVRLTDRIVSEFKEELQHCRVAESNWQKRCGGH